MALTRDTRLVISVCVGLVVLVVALVISSTGCSTTGSGSPPPQIVVSDADAQRAEADAALSRRERAEADAALYRGYLDEMEVLAAQLEALAAQDNRERWGEMVQLSGELNHLRSRIARIPELPSRRMVGRAADDLNSMFRAIFLRRPDVYERDPLAFAESMADLRLYIEEVRDGW